MTFVFGAFLLLPVSLSLLQLLLLVLPSVAAASASFAPAAATTELAVAPNRELFCRETFEGF